MVSGWFTIDMIYGKGISKTGELLDTGVEMDFVSKSGNWYEIAGEKIGNGREAAKLYLEKHADVAADLEDKIRETWAKNRAPEND